MKTQEITESTATESFEYSFESSKSPEEVFQVLMEIDQWWSGLHGETIAGESQKLNDEFAFRAGKGAHYSKQKLIEFLPNKRIGWQVLESNLSFLKDSSEWTDTKIGFDISEKEHGTLVTFTHEGLVPQFECYTSCAGAWTKYMENLEEKLT
ncbi:SRPBCC family protein [Salmonirosea aquatica]|uniref:SRPBCC domain-containing protein n=1 Tax=Salmonirosea aquatica TaxID=2654236 RepID=A0A7C9BRY4_9BACT|nr:SRPBCC domain-containing protein [Cytophagaceae bacterium SJW1-29]